MAYRILVWFRNDLRLLDHEPLYRACQEDAEILPVYCFDPRHFQRTPCGFAKTGAWRGQFLLESLADLQQQLQRLGSEILICQGKPETIVPQLVEEWQVNAVYFHQEAASEETSVEKKICKSLKEKGVKFTGFWGHTLYHPQHLPFQLEDLPEVFTSFRKSVENIAVILPPLPAPDRIVTPFFRGAEIPSLTDLQLSKPMQDDRAVLSFQGGETAGKERLKTYFWEQDCLRSYKETRNGMIGANYSSKFSAWLALGCLSPRYIYAEVKRYESDRVANDSTYWLIFELLWRDYFRFITVKHGNAIFRRSGLRDIAFSWQEDWQQFLLWQQGNTGVPLIDANMKELLFTGFMSNRGRQNVASFLTKNMGINWQWGAEWFESQLIDYDVCSNWGNWNYTAGIGNDARGFRYFNTLKQAKDYDPKGHYVKHWLPVLKLLPAEKVHQPWLLSPIEQEQWQVKIGLDYPSPLLDPHIQVTRMHKG